MCVCETDYINKWLINSIHLLFSVFGDLDLKEHGIPTQEEYLKNYCQLMGIPQIENWEFYIAFMMFRYAAILQGVYKRYLQGIYVSLNMFY